MPEENCSNEEVKRFIEENFLNPTGNFLKKDKTLYQEFIQGLPAPDYFRYYYFPKEESNLALGGSFDILKYQPQVLQNEINKSMIRQMKEFVKEKGETN